MAIGVVCTILERHLQSRWVRFPNHERSYITLDRGEPYLSAFGQYAVEVAGNENIRHREVPVL